MLISEVANLSIYPDKFKPKNISGFHVFDIRDLEFLFSPSVSCVNVVLDLGVCSNLPGRTIFGVLLKLSKSLRTLARLGLVYGTGNRV